MNVATATTAPVVTSQASNGSALKDKIAIRNLDFYYGDSKALKGISLPLYANKRPPSSAPLGVASRHCFAFSIGCMICILANAPKDRCFLTALTFSIPAWT